MISSVTHPDITPLPQGYPVGVHEAPKPSVVEEGKIIA